MNGWKNDNNKNIKNKEMFKKSFLINSNADENIRELKDKQDRV